jgi:putative DNA primase/helicase
MNILSYVAQGMSLIPVGKDKKPLIPWKEYQSRCATDDEIDAWKERYGDCNWGIVTGKISGITVVDVDTYAGGDPSVFPETYTVKTGNGGLQLYYQYHPGLTVSAGAYPHLPHVDLRSDGGFVVAPPSVITPKVPGATGVYEVVRFANYAPFPIELFGEGKKQRKTLRMALQATKGSRNDSMASVIGTLLQNEPQSAWEPVIWPVVERINRTFDPPLSETELKTVFRSIARTEEARRMEPSPVQIAPEDQAALVLRKSKNLVTIKDMTNACMVFEQHPLYRGKLRYNLFQQAIEFDGEPLRERDVLDAVRVLQENVEMLPGISKNIVYDAMEAVAHRNSYDEVMDYLNGMEWDGVPRLATWLPRATGVEENDYHRGVGAQWLIHMVKRMVSPGCMFDHCLVLSGGQGIGKTSLLRIIGGPWYKSYSGNVSDKDFFLQMRGGVLVDLDEGVAMYKSDAAKLKSTISSTFDEYRSPYGKVTERHKRRFVFALTTNETQMLHDSTGNRRYWIVNLQGTVDFAWLTDNRDQLFAEAYHAVRNGGEYPEVPPEDAKRLQEEAMPSDEWEQPIEEYLRTHVGYCQGDPDFHVTIGEVHNKALRGELTKLDTKVQMRIGRILTRSIGMERRRVRTDDGRSYAYYLTPEAIAQRQEKNLPLSEFF